MLEGGNRKNEESTIEESIKSHQGAREIADEECDKANDLAPGAFAGSNTLEEDSLEPESYESSSECRVGPTVEDEEVVERDAIGRFHRYDERVGQGRFKAVYKAYDTENGVDVAWCKVGTQENKLTSVQLEQLYEEMCKGLTLDHPNIIRCLKCWENEDKDYINLVTELFASGTLREFRQHYKQLELKALRRYGRQILDGLVYLHGLDPPVFHGDLRLDKIYVNGFNGEAKIGDLGLATLLAKRYVEGKTEELKCAPIDIYAFGLCMLELITTVPVDRSLSKIESWRLLRKVRDDSARKMISQCLGPVDSRPSPSQLLKNDFFTKRLLSPVSAASNLPPMPSDDMLNSQWPIKVRGEDWNFLLEGFESDTADGNLRIKLVMSKEDDPDEETKLNFDYDMEQDTPEKVAAEIADSFAMTATDREICCSALRESLAVVTNDHHCCESDSA
ncbi:hypothetical protein BSKO_02556 [Bryopsis sp. KO-2023]|nr:hypothetical protein BSKO_02556 [Bryopsis sp. KO-2023]